MGSCKMTEGCVFSDGSDGRFHRSCDCTTVDDLWGALKKKDEEIRDLKVELCDALRRDY